MGDHGGRVLFLQQKNEGFFSGSSFFLIQDRKEEQKMRTEKVWVFAAFAVFAGICTGCRSTAAKTAGTWEPGKIEISSLQTADESGQCFGILVGRGGEEEAFYSPKNGATRNIIGSLEDLLALVQCKDVQRAVRDGLCSVYHGAVHNLLYEKSTDVLKALYKSAVFTVQAIVFLESGRYVHRHKDLLQAAGAPEQKIVHTALALRRGADIDFTTTSQDLLLWAQSRLIG